MIYQLRDAENDLYYNCLIFNTEEEFTAFENRRRKEFGKNWCLFDESNPVQDIYAQVFFNFLNTKEKTIESVNKLENEFIEFILRHKQSLMFYHNLTCWEDKNGDHYGNIPELEKLTDEELIDKEWKACGEPRVHRVVHYPDPTVVEEIPEKPKSLRYFVETGIIDEIGTPLAERIAPDGTKDYVVEFYCGV